MKHHDGGTDVDLDDFVDIATRERWGSDEEIAAFAEMWTLNFEAGTQGFGNESTVEDWRAGLHAWRGILGFIAAVRQTRPELADSLELWMQAKAPMPEFRVEIQRTH